MKWLRWIPWILASVLLSLGAWAVTDRPHSGLGFSTATSILDGLIVEADLNEDSETPTDGDVLTFDDNGNNFNWIAQSAVAATETNTLSTVVTGISDDQLIIGTATDTAKYTSIETCNSVSGKITYSSDLETFGCGTDATCQTRNCAFTNGDSADELFQFLGINAGEIIIGSGTFGFIQFKPMTGDIASMDLNGVVTIDDSVTVDDWIMGDTNADTQSVGDDSTLLATTAFVQDETVAAGDVTGTLSSGLTIGAGVVEETMMSTEDFGDFSCGASADDCVLDTGVVDATALAANSVDSDAYIDASVDAVHLANLTRSMYWGAGAISSDGTQCANAAEVTPVSSGPKLFTIICADNDASVMHGSTSMPDGWDAGNMTFELIYLQTASDTSALEWDIFVQCRGATEAVNSTYETAVNVIDSGVSGSNKIDNTTSGNVTCGSDAGGDQLFWRIDIDASGTATGMTTLHIIGLKVEYAWNPDDA